MSHLIIQLITWVKKLTYLNRLTTGIREPSLSSDKFGQIIYLVVKTDNIFIIFTFLKNLEMVEMTTIFKCFMFRKYSSCVGKVRGVLIVVL